MKVTRYKPEPNQPFGLHDCHINGIDILNGNVTLTVKDVFYAIGGRDVRGSIAIEKVDPDCCEVIIQGRGGKMGGFRGEKLTIQEFTEKYKDFSFEVIDEYYGWCKLQLVGWLWMPDSYPRDMTLRISYFKGEVVYNTEKADDNHSNLTENINMTYCGGDCSAACSRLAECGGCEKCAGHPFDGSCIKGTDIPKFTEVEE